MTERPERRPREGRPARMEPLARLPVFFALQGKRVVLAGASDGVAWKAELLAATGATVDLYAPEPASSIVAVAADPPAGGAIRLHDRAWEPPDLTGAALAVGDCEDEAEASAFVAAAREAGIPVNVVDKPDHCDFAFGAIVNRSPLVIGISSDGATPVLTQMLRAKIEALVPKGLKRWAEAAKAWRPRIQAASGLSGARRRLWQRFAAMALARAAEPPSQADLDALLDHAGEAEAAAGRGEVLLVGAGPGDPELLTLRAVRALQAADVVLYDDLVSAGVLDFARREARVIQVGKTGHGPSTAQADINGLLVDLAAQGQRVVRLKGGDPSIFGRAGEEIAACRAAGIPVAVIPGVTTAIAAAADLGVSLTHRDHAQRVQFVTGHGREGGLPAGLNVAALADPRATTCVYMGRNTARDLARRLIEAGLPPQTTVICLSDVSHEGRRSLRTSVREVAEGLDFLSTRSPTIILIGDALAAGQGEGPAGAGARVEARSGRALEPAG